MKIIQIKIDIFRFTSWDPNTYAIQNLQKSKI